MGYFTRPETELLLGIRADDPHRVSAETNWPYYLTRLQRCEGFELAHQFDPDEGGHWISGEIDLGQYNYLWLRKSFGSERGEDRYWRERKLLPETPEIVESNFRVGPSERETTFRANADDGYWLSIETDAAVWINRLEDHPFAVLVKETRYRPDSDGEQPVCRRYLLPRSLLTVRQNRPQYTEEYKAQLRDRMNGLRAAA